VNKILDHGSANIWQLKLVYKKFSNKLKNQTETVDSTDQSTLDLLTAAIENMEAV
jgi:hypothetical protein